MSQRPPVPAGSVAPYPAHPLPHSAELESDVPSTKSNERDHTANSVKILAAIGIGSAAMIAALFYARQRKA